MHGYRRAGNEMPILRFGPRPSSRDTAKFAAAVAVAAIFVDAAVGHGLTWENDPYWTYWVTKTFLIFTVFGLGTAWLGTGAVVGAVITAVHTLVLTVYYWSLSPVGLPSTPQWLDLEHTWLSGVPIHFGVIYLGYLLVLWVWRRRVLAVGADAPGAVALRAVLVGVAVVVVAGGLASLALGEFPGVTWFVVRLLVTIPFLLVWWGIVGRDVLSSVVGAVVLAFGWATYSQFVGPIGLPDTPLRLLDAAPPPASVRWLDYRELWLISLPVYLVSMAVVLAVASPTPRSRAQARRPLAAAAALGIVLSTTALTVDPDEFGVSASFSAAGAVTATDGAEGSGQGTLDLLVTDMGDRVTPLPPHDRVNLEARFDIGGTTYVVTATRPMVEDPLGRETTWWGVGYDIDYPVEPGDAVTADVVVYALGTITVDGTTVASSASIEVLASRDEGSYGGLTLELASDELPVPELPDGALAVRWDSFSGSAPEGPAFARYAGGGVVLVALVALGLLLTRERRAAHRP